MEALGDFTIEHVLGEGGSGIVYAAIRGEQRLALKVLRPELTLSEREQSAFVAEAQRAQRVTHPSLIAILDVGILPDGRPYIAMPRLVGESLADRIERGPMLFDTALRLFRGLAGAVQALHDAGLIHRDIKPENVFIVGDAERLVLLDLGIARDIEAPASTTTQAGLVRGTPAYMAPERFFGTRASVASDIYEVTVVLYAMLVSGLPWDHAQGAKGRISPRDPRDVVPMPEDAAKVMLRALSVDDADRPASAQALLDELEKAATSKAEADRVTADLAAFGAPAEGARTTGPAAAIAPAATSLATAAAAEQPVDSRGRNAVLPSHDLATQDTVAVTAMRAKKPGPAWLVPLIAAGILGAGAAGAWAFLRDEPLPWGLTADSGSAAASGAPTGEPSASATAAQDPSASASAKASPSGTAKAAPSASVAAGAPGLAECDAMPGIVCSPEYTKHAKLPCAEWTTRVKIFRSQDKSKWPALNNACRADRAAAQAKLAEWRLAAQKKK